MDLQKTAREIGLFETNVNLARVCGSADVRQKAGESMPLPDENIADQIPRIAQWLHSFGKSRYMFLTPEIALIEELARISGQEEAIIAVPCDLEEEAKQRLRSNLPRGMRTTVLEEPYFPQSFFPGNGLMVICGYAAGNRPMVLADTYRMAEHYSGFLGKKVFVPYKELENAARYDGWLEMNQQRFTTKWRSRS